MSFMDKLNATVKKKQTALPKAGIAQNAVTNHSYTQGKSRVQGNQGVSQGNQGWKSQHVNTGGYGKQINPIINSLSQAPTYQAPKITESLLTQGGFNQALGVVGARNNAKLKSQNQRVLQGVLGSLVSGDSQNRAIGARQQIAGMQDATDRRGQDFTATAKAEATAQAGVRDANTKGYYDNQNELGIERNRISNESMLNSQKPKPVNPIDDQIKRQKLAESEGFVQSLMSAEEYDEIGDDTRQAIKSKFIMTGETPTGMKRDAGFFDDDYAPQYGNTPQVNTPTQQPQGGEQQKAPIATGKLFDALATKYKTDRGGFKLSDDGKSILFPDGTTSPLENVQRGLGL